MQISRGQFASPSGVAGKGLTLPPAETFCRAWQCRIGPFGRRCLNSDGLVTRATGVALPSLPTIFLSAFLSQVPQPCALRRLCKLQRHSERGQPVNTGFVLPHPSHPRETTHPRTSKGSLSLTLALRVKNEGVQAPGPLLRPPPSQVISLQ